MNESRPSKLFRDGEEQAVHIPRDLELPGTDVIIRKLGNGLLIEPKKKQSALREWLATLEPLDEEWPEIPDPPPEPVDL